MMENYKKEIRLIEDSRKEYLLSACQFKRVYDKYKSDLEMRAMISIFGEFPKALANLLLTKDEVLKETCKEAIDCLRRQLKRLPYITGYVASVIASSENVDELLRDIAALVIQE